MILQYRKSNALNVLRVIASLAVAVISLNDVRGAESSAAAAVASGDGLANGDSESESGGGWYERCEKNLSDTWHSKQWEIFVPVYEWHNRAVYGNDAKQFNEMAWGIGFGKSHINERGNRCSIFAMGFLDSYKKIEPIAGVMWQKLWRTKNDSWRVSLGAAAGLTARDDLDYVPIPFVLPVVGVELKRFAIECTYVPKVSVLDLRGNILLFWTRWKL